MKALPAQYAWLNNEPGPAMLIEALKHYGLLETAGTGNTAELMAWSQELNLTKIYTADSIAWCGLFMAILATRCGKEMPFSNKDALWARNWAKFGTEADQAKLGYVLVFKRGVTAGHVGLYIGEDKNNYHVLAGNQGDKVSIVRIEKSKAIAIRKPPYRTAEPANVRVIHLEPTGEIFNEAA